MRMTGSGTGRSLGPCIHQPRSAPRSASGSRTTPAPSPGSPPRSARPAACSARSTSSASRGRRRSATSTSSPTTSAISTRSSTPSGSVEGVEVVHVSDRVFLAHLGGKLEVRPRLPLKTRDDLSMVYTPGVARVSQRDRRGSGRRSGTSRSSATRVAVVSDGTAVLGLGDIGPEAAMPVMEGKAVLFKEFAGVDAFPICLATKDPDEIVAHGRGDRARLRRHQPRGHLGAALLRDRARGCASALDIPVFHDDQHGTAIVVLAALLNALRVVGKRLEDVRIVTTGCGAAGIAVTRILQPPGVDWIVGCDEGGALYRGREGLNPAKQEYAETTNPDEPRGAPPTSCSRAPTSSSASRSPARSASRACARMAPRAIVFAMANPNPEVDPEAIEGLAEVIATGRSDYPNQINNVLAFPGVFRGALDVRARDDRRRDGARRRSRDRGRDRRRRARGGLRDPERLQPRGRAGRGRGGRRGGAGNGSRPPLRADPGRCSVIPRMRGPHAHARLRASPRRRSAVRKVIIMGAGGRDFHNFNVVFRDDPDDAGRRLHGDADPRHRDRIYPPSLAGPLYPDGIPIRPEEELRELVARARRRRGRLRLLRPHARDRDAQGVARARRRRRLPPARPGRRRCSRSTKPVVAVCAVRTGCGKSQTSRRVGRTLLDAGPARRARPPSDAVRRPRGDARPALRDARGHRRLAIRRSRSARSTRSRCGSGWSCTPASTTRRSCARPRRRPTSSSGTAATTTSRSTRPTC